MSDKMRVMLAPMAGVTDKPFRQMVQAFGSHLVWTEMVSAAALCRHSLKTAAMMDLTGELPASVAIQLVGNRPSEMARAAQMAERAGAVQVDINMGCPVKKLISNTSGAALMRAPQLAFDIVRAVKAAVDVPVTVKTRLGWDEADTLSGLIAFVQALAAAGAESVAIHARTKAQGYSGRADWARLAGVRKAVAGVSVIANGDVVDAQSAAACLAQTQADGVMIGRGALGRPWVLAQISNKGVCPAFDIAEVVTEHFNRLISYYGHKGLFVARKHLAWYAVGREGVADFRRRVFAEKNPDNVRLLINSFFK